MGKRTRQQDTTLALAWAFSHASLAWRSVGQRSAAKSGSTPTWAGTSSLWIRTDSLIIPLFGVHRFGRQRKRLLAGNPAVLIGEAGFVRERDIPGAVLELPEEDHALDASDIHRATIPGR